jgi:hypothetical protein
MEDRKQEMKDEKPVVRRIAAALCGDVGDFRCSIPRLLLPTALCLALLGGFNSTPAGAQGNPAVVTGAERLVVRRGPGRGYQPVATLSRGSTVDVQEIHGEWARIVTEQGQRGYIKSTFLVLPTEKQRHSVSPAVAAAPTAAATAAAPGSAALQEQNKALEAEVNSLRQELAELQNRRDATPVPAATPTPPIPEQWHAELARLATAVEGLQRRIDARAAGDGVAQISPVDGGGHTVSATSMLFGMIGILVGWLIGGTFGRKQERGRRSRIRF